MKKLQFARHNAVKHGIFAKLLLAGTAFGEEKEQLLELIAAVRDAIRPANDLEEILVEKLAVLLLRQTRVCKAYQKIAPKLFARVNDTLSPGQPPPVLCLISKEDQIAVDRKEPSFDSIVRYEISIDRHITRTLDQIRQLRLLKESGVEVAAQNAEGPHAKTLIPA